MVYKVGDIIRLNEEGYIYYFIAAPKNYKVLGKGSWLVFDVTKDGYVRVISTMNNVVEDKFKNIDEMFDIKYIKHDIKFLRQLKINKLTN